MNNKELELLLDIKKELEELKDKVDKMDCRMKDSFLTLEVAYEENYRNTNRIQIKIMKLERKIWNLIIKITEAIRKNG